MQTTMFNSPHFTIRELQPQDLSDFHEMQGNLKVMQYTTGKANTLEEDQQDADKVIQQYTQANNQFWVWAIERKEDKVFVGTCALVGDNKGTYEIGFRFLEKYWQKGYGTAICNALIDYAFCQQEVKKIIAYVDIRNIGSIKILDQSNLVFVKNIYNEETGVTDRFYQMEIIEMSDN